MGQTTMNLFKDHDVAFEHAALRSGLFNPALLEMRGHGLYVTARDTRPVTINGLWKTGVIWQRDHRKL
jgi:hypothetical protein